MRRRNQSAWGSPVLVGALTVLIAIVAVTLAYQANNGLPFVPRYQLYVQLSNAEELTRGAEVHMGGALVGSVSSITADRLPSGRPIALLDLRLNKTVAPLPVDSRFTVRLKGAIGLKYLDVTLGQSRRTWKDGATVPLSQTGALTDLDQVLSMFTPATRLGIAASTVGFSDTLAGRGGNLNDAIGAFVPLVTDLKPVMRNLAARGTDLRGFIRGLGSFSAALAPVAQTQADLFGNLNTTFRALAGVAVPYLQEWISQTPPTFETVIADSPRLQSFVTDTAGLFKDLRPGFATLPVSAPILAQAFAAGVKNLPGTAGLDQLTVSLAKKLASYGATPAVQRGLDRVTLTAHSLISPLKFLTPVQATCNYATLFLRNISSLLADPTPNGTVLRFVLVAIDQVEGGEAVPSQSPFLTPSTNPTAQHGPLHYNNYPNTASPGQTRECAAGNEPYSSSRAQIGNPPGNVGIHTETTKRSGT
jgi:virulence factor Mce-like protein